MGLDEFLALGLIALSYGIALLAGAYGFLAVFAAGLSVRRTEREHNQDAAPEDVKDAGKGSEEEATNPATAPAYMAGAVLSFNEQLERLGELAMVLVIGAMLASVTLDRSAIWLTICVLVVARPLATAVALILAPFMPVQRVLIAWFGVRGVGSIYYLTFALMHGVPAETGRVLADFTLIVVASSIVLHGISVTPLMQRFAPREA